MGEVVVGKEKFGENKGRKTEEVREMGEVVEVAISPPFGKLSILSLEEWNIIDFLKRWRNDNFRERLFSGFSFLCHSLCRLLLHRIQVIKYFN